MEKVQNIDLAIIGMGAAGSMAAIGAAGRGKKVHIFDGNEKVGKKIYITGKGRCNLTNSLAMPDFMSKLVRNGSFLYSALSHMDNRSTIDFFQSAGLPLNIERGGRVFPKSNHSSDVIKLLENEMKRLGVSLHFNDKLIGIKNIMPKQANNEASGDKDKNIFILSMESGKVFQANQVILACGGISYPPTGSNGDGYKFAAQLGHHITELSPSLVPINLKDNFIKEMQGLSLKNVQIKAKFNKGAGDNKGKKKKKIKDKEFFGEMIFTDSGISGPIVLSLSSYLSGLDTSSLRLSLDWKPALDGKQLSDRIQRERESRPNRQLNTVFQNFLPNKAVDIFLRLGAWSEYLPFNQFTSRDREKFIDLIKNFPLTFDSLGSFSQAVITRGGVDIREINPSTMESKLIRNLYICGEMLDCDALTGGYNLQIAWSSGYLAGISAAAKEEI